MGSTVASHRTDTGDQPGREIDTPPNPSRLDPTIWSDLYEERAAHRQFDGGYPRIEAELLAWRDIEWRWHLAHRERASAEVCAGCGQLILPDETLDLIDGARVHMKECRCRIAYEQRWRSAATNALIALAAGPGHRMVARMPDPLRPAVAWRGDCRITCDHARSDSSASNR